MRTTFVAALLATLGIFTPPARNASEVLPLSIDVRVGPTTTGPYELLKAPQGAKYTAYLTISDTSGQRRYASLALPVPPSGHDSATKRTRWFDVTFHVALDSGRYETSVTIEHEGRTWYEQKNVTSVASAARPSPR